MPDRTSPAAAGRAAHRSLFLAPIKLTLGNLTSGKLTFGNLALVNLALGLCLSLAGVAGARAAASCNVPETREAFDVEGLKSELMVTALSCNRQDRYNDFVAKFRPALTDQERALDVYFHSTYGRAAQREHDNYITQLANGQSDLGLKSGTSFCDQRTSMFDEVAALESASDLGGYAEAKDIAQPAAYETCRPPTATGHGRVRRIRSASHRHRG